MYSRRLEGAIWEDHQALFPEISVSEALEPDPALIEKGLPQVFGYPGGKHFAAKTIVPLIPPHATYTEPFCGSAAIFWAKEPSPEEVLSDLRKSLIKTFRFLRDEGDFKKFLKLSWKPSPQVYASLMQSDPPSLMGHAYRFIYLAHTAFNGIGGKSYSPVVAARLRPPIPTRLEAWRVRLQGVHLLEADALKVLPHFDSPYTFHYIDPPYPQGRDMRLYKGNDFTMDDLDRMVGILKNCRGKFLISLNAASIPQNLPSHWWIRKIYFAYPKIPSKKENRRSTWSKRMEVLIGNYDLKTGAGLPPAPEGGDDAAD